MKIKKIVVHTALVGLVLNMLLPSVVSAAQITSRSLTLSTSSPAGSNATTTYTFAFAVPTTGTIVKSFEAQMCTTASGICTPVTGFGNSSSISQPVNLGDASGWTGNTATAGSLRMTNNADLTTPTATQTVVFTNVQNPTTANTTFYARLTTFSDSSWSAPIDTGVVTGAVVTQIVLTGTMPESLVFCVGTGGTDCATMTGSTVGFGFFSPVATSTGTSLMSASTNAATGYVITVNGTSLTTGLATIPAMGTQTANSSGCVVSCTSTTGISQFGSNVRSNTTPTIGADVTGLGSAIGAGGYNTADAFRFFTGDVIASVGGATKANLFTNSYIVNVGGDQTAGAYTATMTYICTATF